MTEPNPTPDLTSPKRMALAAAVAAGLCVIALLSGQSMIGAALALACALAAGLAALQTPDAIRSAPQPPTAPESPDFRAALEEFPDAVLIVEGAEAEDFASRRIRFANAEARALLRTAATGAALVSVLRDPEALEVIDEALFAGLSRTVPFEPAGAQSRIYQLSATPLHGPVRATPTAVVRLRDETDARQMERMRADFLANASHELKTPLASLQGFIETLKGHARDDDRARDKFLDIMAAQTARMSRMIADLLSLSRIEMREHIPPADRADVALAASDVLDALGPLLDQQGARVEIERGEASPVVVGERDQLIQVIQNLTENAVRYGPKGGVVTLAIQGGLNVSAAQAPVRPGAARLAILTPDRSAETRYVRIDIQDHGRGLPREALPRLTERFYRIEGQKSGESPGTGLGLSIVKHIVNRHRGGLVVESQEGAGTVFTVYLPQPMLAEGSHKTVTEPS